MLVLNETRTILKRLRASIEKKKKLGASISGLMGAMARQGKQTRKSKPISEKKKKTRSMIKRERKIREFYKEAKRSLCERRRIERKSQKTNRRSATKEGN